MTEISSNLTWVNDTNKNGGNRIGPQKYILSFALVILTPLLVAAWHDSTNGPWPSGIPSAILERPNVAAAENGGRVSASSSFSTNFPPNAVIDGDRKGLNCTAGGCWADGTAGVFPDWIQVDFSSFMSIDEIDVITLQDDFWTPVEPTEMMTFYNKGITSFDVQYWDGSSWLTIPGGSMSNNNKVWRKFTFSEITTSKIRIMVNGASNSPYSFLAELEAYGRPVPPPDPTPTPTPTPQPPGDIAAALADRDIYLDLDNNIGFGTPNPVFNDDGTTGANVGKWVGIDGKTPGASAYLGLGGTIPNPGDRVGSLNFYNLAMGGVDHRTATIFSFNGPQLGTGNLEFSTAPNFIGPVRRMQIAPTGEVGINIAAGIGTMVSIMGKTSDATTHALGVLDGADRPLLTVRNDGQIAVGRPGQGIVLRSPNGQVCRKLVIDDTGALVVQPMGSCP